MAFDQSIQYKVNIDDSDFQAKLTQLRSSLDMTMGAGGGFGGMGMGAMGSLMAGGGMMFGPGNTGSMMRGLADFGSQVRPITYTPPAIAMQPHFGMVSLQQSTGQAFLGSFGLPGIGVQSALNFVGHPIQSFMNGVPDPVPNQMSYSEYTNLSARAFATRAGDAVATGSLAGVSTLAGMASGGLGALAAKGIFGTVAASAPWTEQLFSTAALGGMALSTAAMLPASMLTSAVGDMMAQNRGIQTQLEAGSFRFIGGGPDADPLTGRGFSRRARAEVADFVQTQELHDPRFGMDEMRGILEGGMQLDLFSGTNDVAGFKEKFSGLVSSVKTIMSTLHTSLQEGMEVIRGFRDMGITDSGQISGMTMQAETLGRMSGLTGKEMLGVGQTGAEMFRGTGINMGLGFQTNMMNRTNVRELLNQGLVSRETIGQMGGENAAAQAMTAGALASTQTAFGRGIMMANFDPSTGGLRGDFGNRMMSGDMVGMLKDATHLSPQDILKFQAHQEDMVSSMDPMTLQMFQIGQISAQAKFLTRALPGLSGDDAFVASSRMMGNSIDLTRTLQATLKEDPEKLRQHQELAIESMGAQAVGEDRRNRFSWKGRVSNVISEVAVQPFQRFFTGLGTSISESIENTVARLEGRNPINTAILGSENIKQARALADNPFVAANLDKIGGVQDLRETGISGWWNSLVGGDSTQPTTDNVLKYGQHLPGSAVPGGDASVLGGMTYMGGTYLEFKSAADVKKYSDRTGNGMQILGNIGLGAGGVVGGGVLAISREENKKVMERSSMLMASGKDLEAADSFQASPEVSAALAKLSSADSATPGSIGMEKLENVLMKTGGWKELSAARRAAILEKVGKDYALGGAVKEVQALRGSMQRMSGPMSAKVSAKEAEDSIINIRKNVLGGSGFGSDISNMLTLGTEGIHAIEGANGDVLSKMYEVASSSGDARASAESSLRGMLHAQSVSPETISKIVSETESGSIAARMKQSNIHDDLAKVGTAIQQGMSMTKASNSSVSGGITADIGLLTKDNVEAIRTAAAALQKNIEMLESMQKRMKLKE